MTTPDNWLLCNRIRALANELGAADESETTVRWRQLERVVERAGEEENAEIALPILEQSLPELRALIGGWDAGTAALSEWDNAILKRGLKAYRKRLKLMRLDDESSGNRNPLSRGEESSILGCLPPQQYPEEVWEMLVKQGKLREVGGGLLELATT